jgi:hypothetical protein
MRAQWKRFIADDCGALVVSDWVLLATILVLAVIPSMAATRSKSSGRELEKLHTKKPVAKAVVPVR